MSAAGRLGGLLRYWAESFSLYAGLGMLAVFGMASPATAQIAPWINPSLFDSGVWDTAGPYADSPWYHPPPAKYGKKLGLTDPWRMERRLLAREYERHRDLGWSAEYSLRRLRFGTCGRLWLTDLFKPGRREDA